MKVLLLNDSPTDPHWVNPNWGGRAATVPLKLMIGQTGGDIFKAIPEDDLDRSSLDGRALLAGGDSGREAQRIVKLLVPPGLLKLRRRLLSNPDETHETRLIPKSWADYGRCAERVLAKETPWPKLIASFEDVDVAVIHGNGDIQGNTLPARTLLFLGFLVKKHFKKPVIMVNHTADFSHPDLLRVAQEVYPLFDDVVFRDPLSADLCKTLCEGRFAADTAFWFEPASRDSWTPLAGRPTFFDIWPDTAPFDPAAPYLCIGGSSMLTAVPDPATTASGFMALIKFLQSLYSGQMVMTASDILEDRLFRPIARQLGLPLIGLTTSPQQAADVLGNADAYVGGRWHPAIFALRGGAPVVGLGARTFKMRALTQMAGLPATMFNALDLEHEKDAIGRELSLYLEQGPALRDRLRRWAGGMAQSSWDNVGYLAGARQ